MIILRLSSIFQGFTFKAFIIFCLLVGASSSLDKLHKSAWDQNYLDESLSTNSGEDEIILNVQKAGPEYKQIEVSSDF